MNPGCRTIGVRWGFLLLAWCSGPMLWMPSYEARAAQSDKRPGAGIELPEGPLADLLAAALALEPESSAELPCWPSWQDRGASGWGSQEPWARWAELLLAGSDPELHSGSQAKRRTALALLAKLQGRDMAGWAHLLASGDAQLVAQALPAFLPGKPLSALCPGASELEFDGSYSPALPPTSNPLDPLLRSSNGKSLEIQSVRQGESVFAMRLQLEGDGIQVDLTHVSGPAISIRVLPPEPAGLRIALLYADWVKVGSERQFVPVTLNPGDPTFTIWGRFLNLEHNAPLPRGGTLLAASGAPSKQVIQIVVPEERVGEAFLQHLARAVSTLIGAEVQLVSLLERNAQAFSEPLVIRLGAGEPAEKKLLELIDRVEENVLSRRDQAPSGLK